MAVSVGTTSSTEGVSSSACAMVILTVETVNARPTSTDPIRKRMLTCLELSITPTPTQRLAIRYGLARDRFRMFPDWGELEHRQVLPASCGRDLRNELYVGRADPNVPGAGWGPGLDCRNGTRGRCRRRHG